MEKMTGKQVITVVLGVAALWVSASSYESYLSGQQKTQEEENRHQITLQLIQNQPRLMEIQNEQVASYTNILKSVSDAQQVTLDKTVLSNSQLETITRQERQNSQKLCCDPNSRTRNFKGYYD